MKVDVIEGDGNCLFRTISYEVTLSQDHHGFFPMSACGILQTDLYQSEFESRHLNSMNVSDYDDVRRRGIRTAIDGDGALRGWSYAGKGSSRQNRSK